MADELKQRFVRPAEAMRLLGVKRTCFQEHFVATGRLRKIQITPRSVGFLATDVAALQDEIAGVGREPQKAKARYQRPASNDAA